MYNSHRHLRILVTLYMLVQSSIVNNHKYKVKIIIEGENNNER